MKNKISIIGAGSIGLSIATGLVVSKKMEAGGILLSRREVKHLDQSKKNGFIVTNNNLKAIQFSKTIILSVGPHQLDSLAEELKGKIPDNYLIISIISGVSIKKIKSMIDSNCRVVRAMPNTASSICESITCIAGDGASSDTIEETKSLFDAIGKTLIITEEKFAAATALGACGVAFFLRAIRAASQGGIEIGFHSDEAFLIAAQTAKGASGLVLESSSHPESEIDNVTTPKGATISGLNEMEHRGFSSAMIKGITKSTNKINTLLDD